MSIKMKKSDAVIALILGSVLAGLAACQMEITDGLDLGGTPTTGVDTGSVWMGGGGRTLKILPNFRIEGGYEGPARITYYDFGTGGNETDFTVNVTAAGTLVYSSGTPPTGKAVKSITLTAPSLGPNKLILIGRDTLSNSNKIMLNINGIGELSLRPADTYNNIPIGSYAEFQLINDNTGMDQLYKQEANLDLMDIPWTPIGMSSSFGGTYNGGGHTVKNLLINQPTASNVGLFGVAGGNSSGCEIIACYNTGTLIGSSSVGGIVGDNASSVYYSYWKSGVALSRDGNNGGEITGEFFSGNFPNLSGNTDWATSADGSSGFWKPATTGGGSTLPKLWFELGMREDRELYRKGARRGRRGKNRGTKGRKMPQFFSPMRLSPL